MEINIYKKLFEVKKSGITLKRDTKAHNYKYATLSQIQDKLWDELQKQKLVVIHSITDNHVVTEIRDTESDTFVSSSIAITTEKPQDKWSEITYYRRYNLLSLLDLEVEDDDWKKAQDSIKTVSKTKSPLDLDEYITQVKEETDDNHLVTLWKDFNKYSWTQKQRDYMVSVCEQKKEKLLNWK